ncbi:AI-2E family transporter [Rhodococcus sp. G-MC3]|uniref:AI-2E family transporter n=1 Tax=Rhodococcus sp. G-MC3 TaxID=3046209 RepID=UPI0024BB9030|nr:AI-2E family transporter [Rhodococcus sp. G-MC3]MDJ0395133.1 AI-2E family transporter [Rhodococcus sp. G-MC3]
MSRIPDPHVLPQVPTWSLPRGVIVLLGSAGLVITIAGARAFANVLGPVLLALMLTVAVHPLPNWLRRKGVPNAVAVVAAVLAVWAVLGVLVVSLVVSVAQLSSLLPTYADRLDELVANVESTLAARGISTDDIDAMLSGIDPNTVFALVESIVTGTLGIFSSLLFVLIVALFMAVDGMSYTSRMKILDRVRPDIAMAFSSFAGGTRRYLVISTVFGLIVAVLDGLALWALDVPLPVLWALLAFITNYIPNIGFVLGVIPPALLALLQGGPVLMLAVILVYSVLNVVIQSIIQPKFVGDAVGLSVTLTFLSLVFWAWVLGPLGAILAIPVTLLAKALLVDIDPSTRWADVLLSGGAVPPPPDGSEDSETSETSKE